MRETVLYLAVSLDGYLADRMGGVGWLSGPGGAWEGVESSYPAFLQGVDTVVMGWNTYRQIAWELSPGEWVYRGLASYVVTHRTRPSTDEITFTREAPAALIRRLREQEGRRIWICGGADLAGQLLAEDLIDRLHLTVVPALLGGGKRLFGPLHPMRYLRLADTRRYGEMVDLVYTRRETGAEERSASDD